MNTLLIGYDLNKAGQDYSELIAGIKGYGTWWHHLDSTWLIRTEHSVKEVRNTLKSLIDVNDELLVVDVTGRSAAWTGFNQKGIDWLQQHL